MIVNPGIRRSSSVVQLVERKMPCVATITTPVDATITIAAFTPQCSSGAIEIDSVAAGDGVVVINGVWRLT